MSVCLLTNHFCWEFIEILLRLLYANILYCPSVLKIMLIKKIRRRLV
jgi:hypothetical protein